MRAAAPTGGPRRIEYVALMDVHRASRNAKTHDLPWIKSLITRFGFAGAAIHDGRTGKIVAGHGRLESLEQMAAEGQQPPDGITTGDGGTWLMPVEFGWSSRSDDEAEALAVALNEATTRGGWDERALASILADLDGVDADLRRIAGWDDAGFGELLASLGPVGGPGGDPGDGSGGDPDEVPAPPAEPVTRPGDQWLLGPHRLLCGDSTDLHCVEAVLGGRRADCVWTDPPYGIDYKSGHNNWADRLYGDVDTRIIGPAVSVVAGALRPGAAVYLTTRWDVAPQWCGALDAAGLRPRNMIVWVKSLQGMGDLEGAYGSRWEAVLFAHDGTHKLLHGRPDDIWDVGHLFTRGHRWHPTQKPVELVTRALENSTEPGGVVFDPFAGSCTTVIAARRTGRVAALVELDPRYVDVACRRWQEHTGELPVLASTGEPHDFAAGGEP